MLVGDVASAYGPVAQGAEFQVSTATVDENYPSVAPQQNGSFIVVWSGAGAVKGRRYDSNGGLGAEFQVGTLAGGGAYPCCSVASDGTGAFVVVWADSSGVLGRRFASDGTPLGGDFQVNTYTHSGAGYFHSVAFPSVASTPSGAFVVVWEGYGSPGTDTDLSSIQGRRYASDGTPQGSQFQVNTYTTSGQYRPQVGVASDGDFVVVWHNGDTGYNIYAWGIEGQRYASSGAAQGGEFRIDSPPSVNLTHGYPSLSSQADGSFVVAWTSQASPGSDQNSVSVQARRYASDGAPIGGQFQVNSYTTGIQEFPSVQASSNGDFVVAWTSYGSYGDDTDRSSIQMQRYASTGVPIGSQFQVNTYTPLSQGSSARSVAADAMGNLLVAWGTNDSVLNSSDSGWNSIEGRRFDAIALGSEFQVNSYTTSSQTQPAVASDALGDFVVVWESEGSPGNDHSGHSIQGQRYDPMGNAVGSEFQVNTYTTSFQELAAVSASPSGDFVVTWQSEGSPGTDTSGLSIQGQRYASNGSALGGEFQVNTYTTSDQSSPDVASEPDGGFVVVWPSNGSAGTDHSGYSIQAQRYSSNGSAAGSQFQVNSVTANDQTAPSVATDALGYFVVVWETSVGSGDNIEGQRYASNGTPQGSEFQVNSYTTSGLYAKHPSVAKAANGDFVVVWDTSVGSGDVNIEGQRFASNGTPQGSEFQVNTYTTNNQYLPSVAMEPSGEFLVTWQSFGGFTIPGPGGPSERTEAQRFASDGSMIGGEFQVSSYRFRAPARPAVSVDAAGRYVVAWEAYGSAGTDSDSFSIHGQRFLPEPESTLGMAAGIALLLALRRAHDARVNRRRRRGA